MVISLASFATDVHRPRNRREFIINPAMWRFIVGCGIIFFGLLFGMVYVFEHAEVTSLSRQ